MMILVGNPFILAKVLLLFGLGLWLAIACFNNIVDRNTNRTLIARMMSMELIAKEDTLGIGLKYRACHSKFCCRFMLWVTVFIQFVVALALLASSLCFLLSLYSGSQANAILLSNWALIGFMFIWLWFMCGGLWFGYWIKMIQTQITHMLLLIITLLSLVVINLH